MTNLEYVWNYYSELPYSHFPVPEKHPGNIAALIAAADGTRNFTCLAVNSSLMADFKQSGELDSRFDYNHDGYPDIPDAGWGFCEHNGKGVGGVTKGKPFTVFWYDDKWLARYMTQAYGKRNPDSVGTYANHHNHWQPIGRSVGPTNYSPYNIDAVNTQGLDGLYYLWSGNVKRARELWDHVRDLCHPVWDPTMRRYAYSVDSDGTYILGEFKIFTDSLLDKGNLPREKANELIQHSISLRSFLLSLQERDSKGVLLGWNGAIGHSEGLINTEGTFLSVLALNALPGGEVYEAGLPPLVSEYKSYYFRPHNVYSAVCGLSQPGYMTSGPDYQYPAGSYQADFYLRCPNPPDKAEIAILSVQASTQPSKPLISQEAHSEAFHGDTWTRVSLAFTLGTSARLSLRTYWTGKADLDVACIHVRRR